MTTHPPAHWPRGTKTPEKSHDIGRQKKACPPSGHGPLAAYAAAWGSLVSACPHAVAGWDLGCCRAWSTRWIPLFFSSLLPPPPASDDSSKRWCARAGVARWRIRGKATNKPGLVDEVSMTHKPLRLSIYIAPSSIDLRPGLLEPQTTPPKRSMALVAPDPRASLSLTESNRQTAVYLQATRTRSRGVSDHGDDGVIPEIDGQSLSPRLSARSIDVEKKWTAWLCVLASFLFLAPSYGKDSRFWGTPACS